MGAEFEESLEIGHGTPFGMVDRRSRAVVWLNELGIPLPVAKDAGIPFVRRGRSSGRPLSLAKAENESRLDLVFILRLPLAGSIRVIDIALRGERSCLKCVKT